MGKTNNEILLHIAKKSDWESVQESGVYGDFSIKKDGFIHCSTLDQLVDVANNNLKKCFCELNRLGRYIQSVDDSLIRQIILYRFENHMSCRQIERDIGGNNNSESSRKNLYRHPKYSNYIVD